MVFHVESALMIAYTTMAQQQRNSIFCMVYAKMLHAGQLVGEFSQSAEWSDLVGG
jgi:hypothetical protein